MESGQGGGRRDLLANKGRAQPSGRTARPNAGVAAAQARPEPAPADERQGIDDDRVTPLVPGLTPQAPTPDSESANAASLLPLEILRRRYGPMGDEEGPHYDETEQEFFDSQEEAARSLPGASPDAEATLSVEPRPTVPMSAPRAAGGRSGWLLVAGVAGLAAIGVAAYFGTRGELPGSGGEEAVAEAPAAGQTSGGEVAFGNAPEAAASSSAEGTGPAGTAGGSAAESGATGAGDPPAGSQTPPPETAQVADSGSEAAKGESPAAAEDPNEPAIDLVRLEPDGSLLIAGRAAPKSALIVLADGEPLGTTEADANGQWVFMPVIRLLPGEHEFGLVIKDVRGRVRIHKTPPRQVGAAPTPAAAEPEPKTGEAETAAASDLAAKAIPDPTPVAPKDPTNWPQHSTSLEWDVPLEAFTDFPPLPSPRPAPPLPHPRSVAEVAPAATGPASYTVQLASVRDLGGAEEEWGKLVAAFPEYLKDRLPIYDEAEFSDGSQMIRIRTGSFSKRSEADALCGLFRKSRQDCLVVRVRTAADGGKR